MLGRLRSGGSLARDRRSGSHDWSVSVGDLLGGWVGRHCERHLREM